MLVSCSNFCGKKNDFFFRYFWPQPFTENKNVMNIIQTQFWWKKFQIQSITHNQKCLWELIAFSHELFFLQKGILDNLWNEYFPRDALMDRIVRHLWNIVLVEKSSTISFTENTSLWQMVVFLTKVLMGKKIPTKPSCKKWFYSNRINKNIVVFATSLLCYCHHLSHGRMQVFSTNLTYRGKKYFLSGFYCQFATNLPWIEFVRKYLFP